MTWKRCLSVFGAALLLLAVAACGPKSKDIQKTTYPAAYLTTAEQADTIHSLTRVNEEGTFYRLDYTADYGLDLLLQADVSDLGV